MVSLLSCRHLVAVQSQVDNCTGLSKDFTSHWVDRPRMCKRWNSTTKQKNFYPGNNTVTFLIPSHEGVFRVARLGEKRTPLKRLRGRQRFLILIYWILIYPVHTTGATLSVNLRGFKE